MVYGVESLTKVYEDNSHDLPVIPIFNFQVSLKYIRRDSPPLVLVKYFSQVRNNVITNY